MAQKNELFPKPCRVLRALGKCTQDKACEFPIGQRGCFLAFEREASEAGRATSLVSLLDFTLQLHDHVGEGGKKVPVFTRRSW